MGLDDGLSVLYMSGPNMAMVLPWFHDAEMEEEASDERRNTRVGSDD